LPSVSFQIADLPGTLLNQSLGNPILLDRHAAGFGWFVHLIPWDADKVASAVGRDWDATLVSAADGRMDLLGVVTHELG
jgi:hypothetical protein